MDELLYWIWLSLCCTPDTSTFPKLNSKYTSPKEIFESSDKELSSCVGYKTTDRKRLLERNLIRAEEILNFCTKRGVGIITFGDDKYPKLLRQIKSPPVLLYYRGKLPDFDNIFTICSVGARKLSDYGRRWAFKINYDLASAGATIVSGMAIGIDGVSHAAAIAGGGRTIAVIGSGIDICYPKEHNILAREIVKEGCVLTEYAPGTPPEKYNFPKRNRIISGLSNATLVFEGVERSGALITARYTKDEGRPVYALPGNVGEKNSEVCNLLLKNGAKPFTSAEDILNDFVNEYPNILNPFNLPKSTSYNLMEVLRSLSVSSNCPGDSIFKVPFVTKANAKESDVDYRDNSKVSEVPKAPPSDFDASAIKVYMKIPVNEACALESLVDDNTSLREVMRALLKLEMNHFIVMLPGEMVKRKFK